MSDHMILTPAAHRDLRIDIGRGGALGDAVMASVTVPAEFRQVQDEYPILFRRNTDRDGYTALAMFGFETGENLFLDGDRWDARYIPLGIAVQPFLIGGAAADAEIKQVHIDMASPRVGAAEGVRVFDDEGQATPYLDTIAEQLGSLDLGFRDSAAFFAALDRYELLEPLTLEITLDDGALNRMVGFHVIDEARLQALDAAALGDLHAEGFLMPAFMAVASIGRMRDLIARRNRKRGGG